MDSQAEDDRPVVRGGSGQDAADAGTGEQL
jgi:hypothetical protein